MLPFKKQLVVSLTLIFLLLTVFLAAQTSTAATISKQSSQTKYALNQDSQISDGSGGDRLNIAANILEPTGVLTFTHGIAAGDVTSTGAVLWTRLSQTGTLTVQVSTDSSFTPIVYEGSLSVDATTDFTASHTPTSLEADQVYFYRWLAPGIMSETGTFHTPPVGDLTSTLRFAYSGDSDGTEVGGQPYYNNFESLDAARLEGLDFFIYLGDVIYSDSSQRTGGSATTLQEYRQTYQVNRQIDALPDLLSSTAIYALWDDHEVLNDYAGQTITQTRYDSGRQAFLEYLPIRTGNLPADPSCAGDPIFRVYSWGQDVDLIFLDERSCRSEDVIEACTHDIFLIGEVPDLAPALPIEMRRQLRSKYSGLSLVFPEYPPAGCLNALADPNNTMLGPIQKGLFKNALLNSNARYKFVINEVPIQQLYFLPYDRWEGYAAERLEILEFIRDNEIDNVVFLTADTHANLVNQVFIDIVSEPEPIAQEFVTGPIATNTLEQGIINLLSPFGQDGVDAINIVLDFVGLDCRDLDSYSYGLVELDATSGLVTVELKDDTGEVLVDTRNGSSTCTKTLGSINYLPFIIKN